MSEPDDTTEAEGADDSGGRRTQQRSHATREKLLGAAIEVFAERGFEGATTREIARRAGVALAALPYHFKTKDALWRAATDQLFARYRTKMAKRLSELADEDEITRTRQLLREFVLFAAENPECHRFILQEGTRPSERMKYMAETHVLPIFKYATRSVERAQELGFGRVGRPDHLYYMMFGAAATVYSLAPEFEVLTGESVHREELVRAHIDSMLDVFYQAASDEPAAGDED